MRDTAKTGNKPFALDRLVESYQLSEFERLVVLLALAPAIDQTFENHYARLTRDGYSNGQCATVDTAFAFCGLDFGERVKHRDICSGVRRTSPLGKDRSKHDAYLADSGETPPAVLKLWVDDLKAHITPQTLVINVGTAGENREDFMLLFGGKKGQSDFAVEGTTFTDLEGLETFYKSLQTQLRDTYDLGVITHETFGNTAAANLSQVIRRETKANVISPRVSMNVLRYASSANYYGSIHAWENAVLAHLYASEEDANG